MWVCVCGERPEGKFCSRPLSAAATPLFRHYLKHINQTPLRVRARLPQAKKPTRNLISDRHISRLQFNAMETIMLRDDWQSFARKRIRAVGANSSNIFFQCLVIICLRYAGNWNETVHWVGPPAMCSTITVPRLPLEYLICVTNGLLLNNSMIKTNFMSNKFHLALVTLPQNKTIDVERATFWECKKLLFVGIK